VANGMCEKIGNTAARCVHLTFSVYKSVGRVGKLVGKTAGSVSYSFKRTWAKLNNLCKRVSAESRLASFDEKQRAVFSDLGKKVFHRLEEKGQDALSDDSVKKLLEEAHEYESRKGQIRNSMTLQKRRMDEIVIFRRATLDLQNEDPRVRRVAVRVLKRLGNRSAIPHLTKSLEDTDPEVRKVAKEALHVLVNEQKRAQKVDIEEAPQKQESHPEGMGNQSQQ